MGYKSVILLRNRPLHLPHPLPRRDSLRAYLGILPTPDPARCRTLEGEEEAAQVPR